MTPIIVPQPPPNIRLPRPNHSVSGFGGIVKKFVLDSNVMAQGKGIVAATAYVEYISVNNELAAELVDAVVAKCFNSSKQATKDAAQELCLMLIEMNNSAEAVTAGLLKGYTNRQPKIAALAASTTTMVQQLRHCFCFGNLSRGSRLYTAPHTPRGVIYVVSVLVC